jgi:hypothetical protein
MKYIEKIVEINLSSLNSPEITKEWNALINKNFYGKELVPFDVKVSNEHKRACWYVHACRRTEIKVKLYEDGSLGIEPIEKFYKSELS